jgi:K+-transporting ATPase ATPase B chain
MAMTTEVTITPETSLAPPGSSPKLRGTKKSLWTGGIVGRAVWDSLLKLNPRTLMKNPVMFVVEVGAVITTIVLFEDYAKHAAGLGFDLQITLWLWFTVLFANFAEAMAEGRGKAQADTLRKARAETMARRMKTDGSHETVAGSKLRAGDVVVVRAGEFIPGDGEVVVGVASVGDHRRISARDSGVGRRPFGGDRRDARAFRRNHREDHVEPRRDVSRPDDQAGRGSRAAEDAQ